MSENKPQQLLWLDMEMTGLDVEREVPIELAAIITDWNFRSLDQIHFIIRQPAKYLDAMDDWNRKHHGESGLLAQVPHGEASDLVDQKVAEWIRKHFGDQKAILAGNSIGQDRLFIRHHLPKIEDRLHYRMLDVTSFKIVFNNLYNQKFKKKDGHRALDDIQESIAELQYYLSHVRLEPT